jgi:hypothetical protein
MSNISLETGLTLPTDRVIPKEDIPDRERECKQWNFENDAVMEEISLRSPVKDKFKTWRVKGYQDGVCSDSRFRFSVKGRSIYRPEELEFNISSIIAHYNLVSPPSLPSESLFCVGKEVDSK